MKNLILGSFVTFTLLIAGCGGGGYEEQTQSERKMSEEAENNVLYEEGLDETERPLNENNPGIEAKKDTVVIGDEKPGQGFGKAEDNRKDEALEKEYIQADSL